MSEHIQAAPSLGSHPPPPSAAAERTPGVAHERSEFSLRLVLRVAVGLFVTAVVIHLAVWWLLVHEKFHNAAPLEGESSLALDDARRPLSERLLDVPPPHLEGIERESPLLVLRTDAHEEQRFYVAAGARVRIGGRSTLASSICARDRP